MRTFAILLFFTLFTSCESSDNGSKGEPIKKSKKIPIDNTHLIQQPKNLSNCNLSITTEIWANELYKGEKKYRRSEAWSEYDYNTVDEARAIPDTIYIQTLFGDKNLIYGEGKDIENFKTNYYISISLQIKYGQDNDCMNSMNPKLTPPSFLLQDYLLSYKDILEALHKPTTYVKLKPLPFNLFQVMKKYNILFRRGGENSNTMYLNQIIVKTYIGKKIGVYDCVSEYIQPMCASIPKTIIIGE